MERRDRRTRLWDFKEERLEWKTVISVFSARASVQAQKATKILRERFKTTMRGRQEEEGKCTRLRGAEEEREKQT